jgi:hypothetical protein
MFKVLRADKDAYITDRVVDDVRVVSGNVGAAGALDLFKLYGISSSGSNPNVELSRLLIHFDLTDLQTLYTDGKVDVTNPSFSARLNLMDVYGGQPTPSNFTVSVFPLSQSFDEGLGRDVVYYADNDVCNFLTASRPDNLWILSGANDGGNATGSHDYVSELGSTSMESTQLFVTGEEDLDIDVTSALSATLVGQIPDSGFRVSFSSTLENDTRTYFVKRFGARKAFNPDKHPRLVIRYDDSIQDDTQALELESSGTLFMYNYSQGTLANLVSGSSTLTGSNSIGLRLLTPISGGFREFSFTGSQHTNGVNPVTGIYSASVLVPSTDSAVAAHLLATGSVKFTPIWGSLDGTVAFLTGSSVTFYPPSRTAKVLDNTRYTITCIGIHPSHPSTDQVVVRVNIFDHDSPRVFLVKEPLELPGIVIRDVHYSVRDAITSEVVIPFDTTYNSTRVSSDAGGMFFTLDMSSLTNTRAYTIDILVHSNGSQHVYRDTSAVFRVNDLQ